MCCFRLSISSKVYAPEGYRVRDATATFISSDFTYFKTVSAYGKASIVLADMSINFPVDLSI